MSAPDGQGHNALVYVNGRLVSPEHAEVSMFDFGFLYGYGLFETMRAYSGVIFRLEEHIDRLLSGAKRLGFAKCLSAERLADACRQTVNANSLKDARVRLTVTPGSGDGMPDPGACAAATVLVVARSYVPLSKDVYERGFAAATSNWRRCAGSAITGTKSLSYSENLLGRFDAIRRGFDEALFETAEGMLAEGAMSNVFMVKSGTLVTPPVAVVLPGIVRGDVLKLAISSGIRVEERVVLAGELPAASEAFLTGSMIELMPLTSVDSKPVGNRRPGPVTGRLAMAYRELVEAAVAADPKR
ncbi:MAG: aminotransferase class IV [Dehalococcoidia bacterium]|nr:aminotransferase class IV [Dehalococcoidia bacterium]